MAQNSPCSGYQALSASKAGWPHENFQSEMVLVPASAWAVPTNHYQKYQLSQAKQHQEPLQHFSTMDDKAAVLMEYSLASDRACTDTPCYKEKNQNQPLADKMRGKRWPSNQDELLISFASSFNSTCQWNSVAKSLLHA